MEICNAGGAQADPKEQRRPLHKKDIGVKWLYRTKLNSGSTNEQKARMAEKGYAKMFGVNFSDSFSPACLDR